MKKLKYFIAVAALAAALTFSVKAATITITDLGQFTLKDQNPINVLAGANGSGLDSGVLPGDQDLLFGGRMTGSSGGSFIKRLAGDIAVHKGRTQCGVQRGVVPDRQRVVAPIPAERESLPRRPGAAVVE